MSKSLEDFIADVEERYGPIPQGRVRFHLTDPVKDTAEWIRKNVYLPELSSLDNNGETPT